MRRFWWSVEIVCCAIAFSSAIAMSVVGKRDEALWLMVLAVFLKIPLPRPPEDAHKDHDEGKKTLVYREGDEGSRFGRWYEK